MEKTQNSTNSIVLNHNITIAERKNIVLTGVKKLNSFDDTEFFIDSVMGSILIKGDKLELLNLDTYTGKLSIKGKMISLSYLDDNKKIKADNIISRLFK
ncbi:MAG: sporulation protein YabP [Bacilli bacterium]|nr:sporulation protein YabP [Bacilli bacterium]